MDIIHERAAGMDISKRDVKVAVRHPGKRKGSFTTDVRTFGATTSQILELIDYLKAEQVTTIVMEATSDYWKPFYYLMEEELPVLLVNAKQARNIPGRKTDVNDATWLANLAAHELLRASFIPSQPIRELRDLTRARTTFVRDRTKVYQRMEKFLESSGIKLSSVASSLTGVSARNMLQALIDGERDATVLAELAQRSMRRKIPQLIDALDGRFTDHHAFMMRILLRQIDELTAVIDQLTVKIDEAISPFRDACSALETIPGISRTSAQVILAEIGADMTVFPDAAHLASWAGVCPGQNESAGRSKSSHTRGGNMYLKAALGTAAMAATKRKDTFFAAKFRRLYARRGGSRALVAVEHTLIVAIWHLLATGEVFKELGPNFYAQRNESRSKIKAVKELERLGYDVQLVPSVA
ncbi:IS110 family transposase [Glutamicibacter bergerei]|uniref:IS110 family transposase n=1 Tax=Glutamicibacter bergerei TaxID=256702 RepID=A0ABV9MJ05_9MICC|nr:IS110 family transposase [Micrococcaceae bacterium]